MIGHVTGKLIFKQPPILMVDVNGVAYEIEATMTSFYDMPNIGDDISLYTHLTIRDDAHLLFGFVDLRQRNLFRILIKASGIGPKVALAILSGLSVDELLSTVASSDINQLVRIPGIGKKTAERMIVDLKDKIDNQVDMSNKDSFNSSTPQTDALSALLSLGYRRSEASRALESIETVNPSLEMLIKEEFLDI